MSPLLDVRKLETTFPQGVAGTGRLEGVAMRSGLLVLLTTHAARWAAASFERKLALPL